MINVVSKFHIFKVLYDADRAPQVKIFWRQTSFYSVLCTDRQKW